MLRPRNRHHLVLALGGILLSLSSLATAARQATGSTSQSGPEILSAPAPNALIVIHTLVIDALGTRTLDTDSARIPFGKSGLLIKNVQRVGAPLALRLTVLALPPQETGIPLTLTAELWTGEATSPPPATEISHREEATILGPESSYLLELEYDPVAERRIVLSIRARAESDGGLATPEEQGEHESLQFLISLVREPPVNGEGPDIRTLQAVQGRPTSYSSGIRSGDRFVGLTLTLTADRVQGDLVTVRSEVSGAEFMDPERTLLQPFREETVHTVTFDSILDLSFTLPPAEIAAEAIPRADRQAVAWHIQVTPSRGLARGIGLPWQGAR